MLQIKPHSYIIKPETEPIFSEQATIVGIDDEAAGVFFTIEQEPADGKHKVSFDRKEWEFIKQAVAELMSKWEEESESI